MLSILIRGMHNFFVTWQKAARPSWEFRLRYATERNAWLIELNEGHNGETWEPLTVRNEETQSEPIVQKFGSWQAARDYAYGIGLQYSYQEVHYSDYRHMGRDERPAPSLDNTPVSAAVEAAGISTHLQPTRPHVVRPLPRN